MEKSPVKQTILGIVIALVTVFFIAYAVSSVYPAPQWDDFCGTPSFDRFANLSQIEQEAQFEEQRICADAFQEARETYERTLFIVNLVLGLVILITAFFLKVEVVSSGLMGGGGLLMIYGTLRYWSELSNLLRTVFLGMALVILIGFGYRKFK